MTFLIGLTGSIGMGKSTTADMFRAEGIPVWDADATVHRLYDAGGAAVAPLAAILPDAIVDGAVSRPALNTILLQDPTAMEKIERIVHPLVAADRLAFVADQGGGIIVLDVPLLFETGLNGAVDMVVVVTAPSDVQRARVLSRPDMTPQRLNTILSRQLSDGEKRRRADHIIETLTLDDTRAAVRKLLSGLRKNNHA